MARIVLSILGLIVLFQGCSSKQPIISNTSATIVFKTPYMKFYDKGFVTKYEDHIVLQVFNAGNLVLSLNIYKDQICTSTFECLDSLEFNKQYLNENYEKEFLYNLFSKEKIYFKNKSDGILIKVQ